MATKKYESMRIMSLEGSVLCKNEGFTATKDGKPDPNAFMGILDESQRKTHIEERVRQDTRGMRGKARRADQNHESGNRRDEKGGEERITKEG